MMRQQVGLLCFALPIAIAKRTLCLQLRPMRSDNRDVASVLAAAFLRLGFLQNLDDERS